MGTLNCNRVKDGSKDGRTETQSIYYLFFQGAYTKFIRHAIEEKILECVVGVLSQIKVVNNLIFFVDIVDFRTDFQEGFGRSFPEIFLYALFISYFFKIIAP